jgi:D-alanyl-D-alanine carboxypeptidase
VLQLVDEGRLSLDDTVQDWLPGILPYADRVTVRHLLTMSSGVPDHLDARFMTGLYDSWAGRLRTWAPRELVALSASRPLSFAPGTGFEYSNTNYVLAGLIVEAVTGRSLGRELTRRVFQPLGLRNTSFPVTWPAIPGPSAHGYSLPLDPNQGPVEGDLVDMTLLNPSFAWAAGNVVSDVDDLTRFLSGLLTGRLLPPALLAEMKTGVDAGDPTVQYGMGIQTIQTPCGPVLGHDGAIPGFVTMVLATEDGRRHFALMMNQYFVGPDLFAAFSATVGELMRRLFPGEECAGTGAGRAAPFAAPAPTLSRSISWSFR